MDTSDLLTLVLVLIGVLSLLGVALIGFVMWRYRTLARLTAPLGCLRRPVSTAGEPPTSPTAICWLAFAR
jgi:uncharacterized iron-regulated membrane protein